MHGHSIKGSSVVLPRYCQTCGQTLRPWQRIACREACYESVRIQRASQRLWSRVNKNGPMPSHRPELGPCWIWTGSRTGRGYGHVGIDCVVSYTHRLAYELTYGPIPEDEWVMHLCDNPPCCRPDHLKAGTQRENIQDCIAKGRAFKPGAHGEANGNAKLSQHNVEEIRDLMTNGARAVDLARAYGVTGETISGITSGRTWSHLG